MDNEPRVKEQLSGSINLPDSDSLVSWWSDQLIDLTLFRNKNHIEDTSVMAHYRLEAGVVGLRIFGLPQFNSPVRRGRDNNIQWHIIDLSVNDFCDWALMAVRRINFR